MTDQRSEWSVEALIAELDDWVKDGSAKVYIDEMPWGKQARIDFKEGDDLTVSRKEHEMKSAILDAYNNLLVALHDIEERNGDTDNTLQTIDDLWELAESVAAFQNANDIESFGDDRVYARLERITEFAAADRDEFKWAEAVASMFDERSDLPEWSEPSRVGRLATAAESREAANSVMEAVDDGPTKRDVRLWQNFQSAEEKPEVSEVVAESKRRFKEKYGYTSETWVKKTQTVYRVLGFDAPDSSTVRDELS